MREYADQRVWEERRWMVQRDNDATSGWTLRADFGPSSNDMFSEFMDEADGDRVVGIVLIASAFVSCIRTRLCHV